MSKKPNGKCLNLENGVIFQGFDSLCEQVFEIEDQLLYLNGSKFKQKQREYLMTLRNCLNHFIARSERSASKPNAKKTSKLMPNDDHDMFN